MSESTVEHCTLFTASELCRGGAADGGSSLPLIIGGVVVLALVGGVGAFLAFSGKDKGDDGASTAIGGGPAAGPGGSDPSVIGGNIDPSKWTYFGVRIGDLSTNDHGVSGKVYAATEQVICINDFNYDGAGPSAVFMAGTTDSPDESGEVARDITKRAAARASGPQPSGLKKHTNERVVIQLAKPIKDYKYFSVYSKDEKKSYGDVKIENFVPPAKKDAGKFVDTQHDIDSASNTLLDSRRIEIKGFTIDAQAPAVFFTVGKGPKTEGNAHKIDDERLNDLQGKDFLLTLPENDSWDKWEWFSAWCFNVHADLGSFNLPAPGDLTVPVYLNGGAKKLARKLRLTALRRVPSAKRSLAKENGKPTLLACTFGMFGVRRAMVPLDGLCDVVFYTDVEFDSDKDAIIPSDGGPAFSIVKWAAKNYNKTTFGTSMSPGSIAKISRKKVADLVGSMNELFSSRLIHFGMLNVKNIEDYKTLKGTDLNYLKVVTDFLKRKTPNRHYHCALGISLRDSSKGAKILDVARQATQDFPGLTMIVVKLHTESMDSSGDHWPVGPNPDGVDLSEHNSLSLAVMKDDIKKRLTDVARHGRYAILSFAMYAKTYRMKPTWSNVSVREASESSLNMDYAAVCKMKAEKESSDPGTMYAADHHKRFLALFDSPLTFASKTKERLRVMPRNFTGLAVYNVEMDDYRGTCGKGRFPRLRAIKEALEKRL